MNLFNDTADRSIVVVTGAAGLLGVSHVTGLLEAGHYVVATDKEEFGLSRLTEALRSSCHLERLITKQHDVTEESSHVQLVDFLREKGLKPDVLINNAALNPAVTSSGIQKGNRIESYSKLVWENELAVGLTGAFLSAKYLLPTMLCSGKVAHVINISSDLSVIPPDQNLYVAPGCSYGQEVKPFSYSVIKAGIHGLTLYLSTYDDLGRLRANTLSPGGILNGQPIWFTDRLNARIPLGRMAMQDEYKGVVKFLVSKESQYLNGQNIVMNGGRR